MKNHRHQVRYIPIVCKINVTTLISAFKTKVHNEKGIASVRTGSNRSAVAARLYVTVSGEMGYMKILK